MKSLGDNIDNIIKVGQPSLSCPTSLALLPLLCAKDNTIVSQRVSWPVNIIHHFYPVWAICSVAQVPRRCPDGSRFRSELYHRPICCRTLPAPTEPLPIHDGAMWPLKSWPQFSTTLYQAIICCVRRIV